MILRLLQFGSFLHKVLGTWLRCTHAQEKIVAYLKKKNKVLSGLMAYCEFVLECIDLKKELARSTKNLILERKTTTNLKTKFHTM